MGAKPVQIVPPAVSMVQKLYRPTIQTYTPRARSRRALQEGAHKFAADLKNRIINFRVTDEELARLKAASKILHGASVRCRTLPEPSCWKLQQDPLRLPQSDRCALSKGAPDHLVRPSAPVAVESDTRGCASIQSPSSSKDVCNKNRRSKKGDFMRLLFVILIAAERQFCATATATGESRDFHTGNRRQSSSPTGRTERPHRGDGL